MSDRPTPSTVPAAAEIRTVPVQSMGELLDHVTPEAPDETGRRRYTGVFHGHVDSWSPLLTSLDRLGGTRPPHSKAGLEEHVLRNFIRYSRPHLGTAPVNEWELLVSAQHHGVPTRLLDWSYSPLVAAFFAVRSPGDHDRAVWRLDWRRVHRGFGFPELALLIEDLVRQVGGGSVPFTPWRLFTADQTARPFACMIEPPSLDARIVAQAAVFTLSSDRCTSFDAFLVRHGLGDALTRFVIPAARVQHFRDQLELAAVDERRLFPDLDGVASFIRRYYG